MSREIQMPTGVGYGVAIPPAKCGSVEKFALAMGISQAGINHRAEPGHYSWWS